MNCRNLIGQQIDNRRLITTQSETFKCEGAHMSNGVSTPLIVISPGMDKVRLSFDEPSFRALAEIRMKDGQWYWPRQDWMKEYKELGSEEPKYSREFYNAMLEKAIELGYAATPQGKDSA